MILCVIGQEYFYGHMHTPIVLHVTRMISDGTDAVTVKCWSWSVTVEELGVIFVLESVLRSSEIDVSF